MAGNKRTEELDHLKNPKPQSGPLRSSVDWVLGTIQTGNSLVSILTGLLAAALILYSSYVLYDSFSVEQGAYSSAWDLLKYKPEIMDDGSSVIQGDTLEQLNRDYRAWLTVYDTTIDYPVVQGPNDLYYASHDVYQNVSMTGAIYLAAGNSGNLSDSYNLIYGHHMDNKAMFGSLDDFLDEAYFNEHQTGVIVSSTAAYDFTLFATIRTDAYENKIYTVGNRAEEVVDFLTRVHAGEEMEMAGSGTSVVIWKPEIAATADKVLALSTCADATTSGRLVVLAKMEKKDIQPASGEMTLRGVKELQGRDFVSGDEWTFTVTAEDGTPMPERTSVTVRPAEDPEINFGTISFTVADLGHTYTYTITESGEITNVLNDAAKTVTVSVAFDEEARVMKLTSSTETEPLVFRNIYKSDDTVIISGRKELTGRGFRADDRWTFTLSAEEGTPLPETRRVTVLPAKDPNFSFGSIVYTEADLGKTYTYTIRETGTVPGVTNDTPKTVTVRIEYDETTNGLKAVCSTDKAPAVFTNAYTAEASTELTGTKVLNGRDFQEGDAWTFRVRGSAGAPMPERTVVRKTDFTSPKIHFGAITFTEADLGKTYTYSISETGSVDGVVNDGAKTVTVRVEYDEETGGLRIVNSTEKTPLEFVNVWQEPVKYYHLTVRYVTEDGEELAPPITTRYAEGDEYEVVPRQFDGYETDSGRVTGTITEDTEITIVYKRVPYTLIIEYQYLDGEKAAETHTEILWFGDEYSVESPEVEGYLPVWKVVSGTMPGADLHIIVFYRPKDAALLFIDGYETPLGIGQHNLQVGLCVE